MKKIKLTQNKYALVDNRDFEWLSQWKWHFKNSGYACRTQHLPSSRKFQKSKLIYMHRSVNKTPKGFHTDHINQDKLDNRRVNLRTTTCSENLTNTKVPLDNSSGTKGVSLYKRHNVYHAYITKDKKRINLGHYKDLKDAIRARKKAEKIYHGI